MYLCALAGHYANINELKRAFHTLYSQLQGSIAPLNGFNAALIELEPTFIKTEIHLDEIWLYPVNPSLIDFLHLNIIDNGPLIDALINSLEHFDWGLDNFKLSADSNNPIQIKKKQCEKLLNKLIELLTEPNSNLLQTYNNKSLEWINRPDTFGFKLTRLWRAVMGDKRLAVEFVEKMNHLLLEIQKWPELYVQGKMAELLDLTRHLPAEQQPELWQLAMHNLKNSEDAAALAEFCQQNTAARCMFKQQHNLLNKKLLNACADEIDRTYDPNHLEAISIDLYRIEDALGLKVKDEIHSIYHKVEQIHINENFEFDDSSSVYYQEPEAESENSQIKSQLIKFIPKIEEMFAELCSEKPDNLGSDPSNLFRRSAPEQGAGAEHFK